MDVFSINFQICCHIKDVSLCCHINDVSNHSLCYARLGQLLEALTTDPRVRGSSPWHEQTFTKSVESRQLPVIPGVGITWCGHIERKDHDTAR